MPGTGLPGPQDYTVFFIAVPIGCFAFGALLSAWMLRSVGHRPVLHGLLMGLVATAIYLAICSIPPNTVQTVIAGYGPPLFWGSQALRIAGCVTGSWIGGRRRVTE